MKPGFEKIVVGYRANDRNHLDTLLAQDGREHRWIAPNGVCWRADVLRERLTLAQRATVVHDLGCLERDTGERRPVIADEQGRGLFLRLNDEDFADGVYLAFIDEVESVRDALAARPDLEIEVRPATPGETPLWLWGDDEA